MGLGPGLYHAHAWSLSFWILGGIRCGQDWSEVDHNMEFRCRPLLQAVQARMRLGWLLAVQVCAGQVRTNAQLTGCRLELLELGRPGLARTRTRHSWTFLSFPQLRLAVSFQDFHAMRGL